MINQYWYIIRLPPLNDLQPQVITTQPSIPSGENE